MKILKPQWRTIEQHKTQVELSENQWFIQD
jgi:hypothetical protein